MLIQIQSEKKRKHRFVSINVRKLFLQLINRLEEEQIRYKLKVLHSFSKDELTESRNKESAKLNKQSLANRVKSCVFQAMTCSFFCRGFCGKISRDKDATWYQEIYKGFEKNKEYIYLSLTDYKGMQSLLMLLARLLLLPFFLIFFASILLGVIFFNNCQRGHSWFAHGGFFVLIIFLSFYEYVVYKRVLLSNRQIADRLEELP